MRKPYTQEQVDAVDERIAEMASPRSWAPEVVADSSGKWCGNALRFREKAAAERWVLDLSCRWFAVRDTRVVPSDEEPNR